MPDSERTESTFIENYKGFAIYLTPFGHFECELDGGQRLTEGYLWNLRKELDTKVKDGAKDFKLGLKAIVTSYQDKPKPFTINRLSPVHQAIAGLPRMSNGLFVQHENVELLLQRIEELSDEKAKIDSMLDRCQISDRDLSGTYAEKIEQIKQRYAAALAAASELTLGDKK